MKKLMCICGFQWVAIINQQGRWTCLCEIALDWLVWKLDGYKFFLSLRMHGSGRFIPELIDSLTDCHFIFRKIFVLFDVLKYTPWPRMLGILTSVSPERKYLKNIMRNYIFVNHFRYRNNVILWKV